MRNNMNHNTNNWKYFTVGKLFDIYPTKAYNDMSNDDLNDGGNTPFVINSAENNAIGGYSTLPATEKAGIITFSDTTDGNTFFYQPHDFIGFPHVQGMHPIGHQLTEKQALFLTSILMFHNKGLFNYGRKMRRDIVSKTKIKLPVLYSGNSVVIDESKEFSEEGFIPDWQFMEDYIKSLHYKSITTQRNGDKNVELNTDKWKEFLIKDLFDVQLSKGDIKFDEMELGTVPLVSSGETNNGIVGYIDSKGDGRAEIFPSNTLTVDMFCNAYYQPTDYYAVSHGRVNILFPLFDLNIYTGLFLASIIKKEKFKYSYGRAVYSNVVSNMKINLPIDSLGNPDWQFMEDYIKSLPYSDRI